MVSQGHPKYSLENLFAVIFFTCDATQTLKLTFMVQVGKLCLGTTGAGEVLYELDLRHRLLLYLSREHLSFIILSWFKPSQ